MSQIVYHYCRASSLLGMIRSRKLHLGNVLFMNDHLEIEWFRSICRSILDDEHDRITKMKTTVHAIGPAAPSHGSSSSSTSISVAHSYFHRNLLAWLSKPVFDHVYCGCFSEVKDDLSQWRGYADDARGVCVGMQLDTLLQANASCPMLRTASVEYNEQKQRDFARSVILQAAEQVSNDIGDAMTRAAFAHISLRHRAPEFKNPCFSAEREVRLITHTTPDCNSLDKSVYNASLMHGLPSQVDFKERDGKPIPFVTVEFPLDAITEVWVGPRFGSEVDVGALRLFLTMNGIQSPVTSSKASYRG